MKSFLAQAALWFAYLVGLTLGLVFCLAVGTGLGYSINHAPISGLLCGLAWWTFGYAQTASNSYERMVSRIERIKALA